jgi:hypothetical protein
MKMIDRNKFSPMIMVSGMLLLNNSGAYAGGNFEVKRMFQTRIGNIAMYPFDNIFCNRSIFKYTFLLYEHITAKYKNL